MTATEFKAWLDGYCEGLKGQPTKAQIERIKEKAQEMHNGCGCGCGCWHPTSWLTSFTFNTIPGPIPLLPFGTIGNDTTITIS